MKMFSPVIRFLNSLKYGQKFLLIGIIILTPLFILGTLYILTTNDKMVQIGQNVEGAKYNEVLKEMLENTQRSGSLQVAFLTGDTSVADEINETVKKANEALEKLIEIENNSKYEFHVKNQLVEIQTQWEQLQQTEWENQIEVQIEYDSFNKKIIQLMTDVANDSGLLLASTKQLFNLIYNTTVELPHVTDQLVQLRSIGTDIVNSGSIVEAQEEMLNTLYYPMQDILKQMEGTMAITFEDEHLRDVLQPKYEALTANINTYSELVNQLGKETFTIENYYLTANAAIDANYDFYTTSLTTLVSALESDYNALNKNIIIMFNVLVIIFIVATILFIGLYLSVRQSIKTLEEVATEVANGNLTVAVTLHTKDEMKNIEVAFNEMTSQLNELVREISLNAEYVSSSSEELHASAEEATNSVESTSVAVNKMASDTEIQATSLKESSLAMDEMAIGIERIAENSARVSALTNEATNLAKDGNISVEQAFNQMSIIKNTVVQTSEKVEQLNKQSAEIDSIVNVITEISDQTNLLALNAAIEAARAGEHGKGFAVVADEVRKLAEQSRQSASQIAELIRSVQTDTKQSVLLMDDVTKNVDIGIQVTEDTANKFENILTSMYTLNPQMEEISATAIEFSAQTEQIVSAIQQILEIAQRTNESTDSIVSTSEEQIAIMQEVSLSADTLSKMAESLQQLVTKFKL